MQPTLFAFLLQLFGILVIIAEIILPSGGILSLIAAGVIGYSLFVVFTQVSNAVGIAFVAADVIILPLLVLVGLKMLARSPLTLKERLSRQNGVVSQSPELDKLMGKEGVVSSALHPAGTAVIDTRRVDVVSRGEFIEKGTEVVVVEVTGNRIVVKTKDK